MARYTKTSLGSNYASKQQIDSNLDDIKTAIDDTLSRKGDSPNSMEADLDMNSNQILNLPDAVLPQEPVTLSQFNAQSVGTKTTQTLKQKHVATAGQTVFATPAYVIGSNNLSVYINGVRQDASAYTETSTTSITLSEGAELSDIVEVLVNELQESTDQVGANNVTYDGSTVAVHLDALTFDTVADMVAATDLQVGMKVKTWGYTTLNDGGGAEYEVVASGTGTDDGGSFIDLDTHQAKLLSNGRDITPKQFGAAGDGVTDDLVPLQKLALFSKDIWLGEANDSYDVSGVITLQSGTTIRSNGATITQTTANTEIFNIESKSNILIDSVNFVGKGDDHTDSDSSRAVGVYGSTSGDNLKINNCTFTGFCYTPARFKAQSNCYFTNNIVIGPDATIVTSSSIGRIYGVLFDGGCDSCVVSGCDISQGAQGVRVEASDNIRIIGNNIHNILGQHGVYSGSDVQNILVDGNVITDCELQGLKFQAQDAAAIDNVGITVTGNIINTCGDQGIFIGSSDSPATYKCKDVTVTGNSIKSAGGQGVYTDSTEGIVISGNFIDTSGQSGIAIDEISEGIVEGNFIVNCVNSGIRDVAACTNITIKDNVIKDCATGNAAGDEYGIFINAVGSEYVIDSNVITDANANMERAIYISANINSTLSLTNNVCPDSTASGVRFGSTDALRAYSGNIFNGAFNDPLSVDVASATTITLPQGHRVYDITGTTNISTINANGHSGDIVTLVFNDVLTVNDGSNLRLAGNFTTSADDSLTLACKNGTVWVEVGRSTN